MAIDWSKSPEGAEFYADGSFKKLKYKTSLSEVMSYSLDGYWFESMLSMEYCKALDDYCERPQQWPETDERINNIGRNRTEDDMGHYNRNADEAFGAELKVYSSPKHDSDKPRYDLLPPIAIDYMAQVLTFGAKKYKPEGWRTVDNAIQRYQAALLRHSFAMLRGEALDPESGLTHAAHAMCCAAFIAELQGEK